MRNPEIEQPLSFLEPEKQEEVVTRIKGKSPFLTALLSCPSVEASQDEFDGWLNRIDVTIESSFSALGDQKAQKIEEKIPQLYAQAISRGIFLGPYCKENSGEISFAVKAAFIADDNIDGPEDVKYLLSPFLSALIEVQALPNPKTEEQEKAAFSFFSDLITAGYSSSETAQKRLKKYPLLHSLLSVPEMNKTSIRPFLLHLREIRGIFEEKLGPKKLESFRNYISQLALNNLNQRISPPESSPLAAKIAITTIMSAFFVGFEIGNQEEIEYYLPKFTEKMIKFFTLNDQHENLSPKTTRDFFLKIMKDGVSFRSQNYELDQIFSGPSSKSEENDGLNLFRNFVNSLKEF